MIRLRPEIKTLRPSIEQSSPDLPGELDWNTIVLDLSLFTMPSVKKFYCIIDDNIIDML
jgi:hypothetical protein